MQTYTTALILGNGRSGKAAGQLLRSEGCETVVIAQETTTDESVARILNEHTFDIGIVSPGFSADHPWVAAVTAAGIPLLSELELGWSRHGGATVAVTGSNGKSTAVKWITESMQAAGLKAQPGGNYGIPACEVVLAHPDLDWLVLEVSSFQLETMHQFHAEVAVLLNLLPNHLDRHGTMDLYRRTKARIFGSPSLPGGVCLVPAGLLETLRLDVEGDRNWLTFGAEPGADYYYRDGVVFHRDQAVLNLSGTAFDSPVLGSCTGTAVAAVAASAQIPFEMVEKTARDLQPLPHRFQRLGALNGVEYVNDSKATNLAAVAAALQACRAGGVHLIAGGLPKESDYTFIKEILAERITTIYLTGQASRAMYQAWNEVCPCLECGRLEDAFNAARNAAMPGDTVLLSPGCASFDQFSGFEERGERFMELFDNLVQGGGDAL